MNVRKMVLGVLVSLSFVLAGVAGLSLNKIAKVDASSGSPYWERISSNGWLHYPNAGADLYVMPGYRDNVLNSGVTTLDIPGNKWLRIWDNFSVAGTAEIVDEGKAGGAPLLYLGDDAFFTDVDQANTLGLYGNQNSGIGRLKLGSSGPVLSGSNGALNVEGTLSSNNVIYSTIDGFPLTYLRSWGLGGNGDIYVEPAPGKNTVITDQWSRSGALVVEMGKSIFSTGNVGIGTGTPAAQLHVGDLYGAGGRNIEIGDDTYLSDVDRANTLGIYGVQNGNEGGLVFGAAGQNAGVGIKGNASGDICIGKCY